MSRLRLGCVAPLTLASLVAVAAGSATATTTWEGTWRLDRFEFDDGLEIAPAALSSGGDVLLALACASHGPVTLFVRWPDSPTREHEPVELRFEVPGFGAHVLRLQVEAAMLVAPVYDRTSPTPTEPVEGSIVPEALVDGLARGERVRIAAAAEPVLELSLQGSAQALRGLREQCG
ncbi:MAG: hypothetical protein AAFX81_06070 [Pseudomonadota bacterium]